MDQELEALRQSASASQRLADELATIFSTAPIGMAQLDRDLRYLRINEALAAMNGVEVADHIGKTVREVLPDLADQVETAFHQVIDSGEPILGIEISGETPGQPGVQRAWLESWYPLRNAAGEVIGLNVLAQEITERKLAEKKLRESEERYRSLTKALTSIVWTSDAEGRFVTEQPLWARFTGQTWEEYQGFGWVLSLHEDDRERVFKLWDEACKSRTSYSSTGRLWHAPSNAYRYFEARAVPIFDADGSVREWVGKYLDVEERQRAQARADELVRQLKEGDQRKDEFLAMLAHELRGPLAPLANMLEILKHADGDAAVLRQARVTMERQLSQMVRLVDDLLDVSRISRNKIELRRERVELSTILNQALEMCRPLAERAHHAVAVKLPPEPLYVDGDPVRLTQVFANLLNNAYKYTAPGGSIRLAAIRQGGEVAVRIKDNGMGIPAEMLPNIFDMFIQLDRSIERTQGGLGIGLTLVRRLIEMHGGTVQANSAGVGHGTEFEVRLPLVDASHGAVVPAPQAKAVPSQVHRILVVDDNRDSATSLAMLLEIEGKQIRTAHDGLEAVAAAADFRPDAIMLDIGLPRINGREVCRRIRAESWGQDIVIVALSGWGQEDDRRKSMEAGFDAHLVKPLDYAALGDLLARLWTERAGRAQAS